MKKLIKERNMQFETLTIITLVLLVLTIGIFLFTSLTSKRKIENFKEEIDIVNKAAKNAYKAFSIEEKNDYVVSNSNGYKAMCITLNGLLENKLLDQNLTNWNGYVVVEDNGTLQTTIWLTNKEYSISNINVKDIDTLEKGKEINYYNEENFTKELSSSFTSGTGNTYETQCIDKKIE